MFVGKPGEFPDRWVLIEYAENDYSVFACWSGGYGGRYNSDSWKRSSPIVKFEWEDEALVIATTASGNKYHLRMSGIGTNLYGAGILGTLENDERFTGRILRDKEEIIQAISGL